MSFKRTILLTTIAATGVALLSGCAPAGAKLCRKDPLIHPEIRFDEHGNKLAIDDHVYYSKEGTPSGRGVGGGGCGCN